MKKMHTMGEVTQLEGPSSFLEDFIIVYCCQRVTVDYSDQSKKVRELNGQPSVYKIGSYSFNYEYNLTTLPTSPSSSSSSSLSSKLPEYVNLDQAVSFSDGTTKIQLSNHKTLELNLTTSQQDNRLDSVTNSWEVERNNSSEEVHLVTNLDKTSQNDPKDKKDFYKSEKDIAQKRQNLKPNPPKFKKVNPQNDHDVHEIEKDTVQKTHKSQPKHQKLKKACSNFSFPKTPPKKITCEECSQEFKMHVSYLLHKAVHSFQVDCGKFVCSACNKNFSSSVRLIQHKRTLCPNPEFVCEFCRKRHVSEELLAHHSDNSCSAFNPTVQTCPTCFRKFFTRNGFLKHRRKKACKRGNTSRTESGTVVKYQCELCGKVYASKSSLAKHIRGHKGIKNYECDKCRKSFADSHQLSVHSRTHSGEKPYLCSQCGKSFGQAGHLGRHLRKHSLSLMSGCRGNERGREGCVTDKEQT